METNCPTGVIEFTVYGKPVPQGSSRAFFKRGMKHPVITSANKKLKPWRQELSATALAISGERKFERHVPVQVTLNFFLQRPRCCPRKRNHCTVRPDVDKLVRAILDGISGILIEDDAQAVRITATKYYGTPERVEIRLEAM